MFVCQFLPLGPEHRVEVVGRWEDAAVQEAWAVALRQYEIKVNYWYIIKKKTT